jgi:hypothetical protein
MTANASVAVCSLEARTQSVAVCSLEARTQVSQSAVWRRKRKCRSLQSEGANVNSDDLNKFDVRQASIDNLQPVSQNYPSLDRKLRLLRSRSLWRWSEVS